MYIANWLHYDDVSMALELPEGDDELDAEEAEVLLVDRLGDIVVGSGLVAALDVKTARDRAVHDMLQDFCQGERAQVTRARLKPHESGDAHDWLVIIDYISEHGAECTDEELGRVRVRHVDLAESCPQTFFVQELVS